MIVADNGSDDGSAELARDAGALVVFEPRRGYGSAYLAGFAAAARRLHRDGRRRPHLRLRRHPPLRRAARRGRRARDGRPHGQHPAGRDALAAPLRRQPGSDGPPQPLLPHRRQGRPLRHARGAPLGAPEPRPAHHRHGVRLGDGDPRGQGAARDRGDPDPLPPARGRVEALELPRRLAPPALPARPQPQLAVHRAGRDHGAARGPGRAHRAVPDRGLRARVGPALDGRRGAADDRRHPGARARALRARLRHLLHGREGPLVRPHAGALPARARAAPGRRDHARRAS